MLLSKFMYFIHLHHICGINRETGVSQGSMSQSRQDTPSVTAAMSSFVLFCFCLFCFGLFCFALLWFDLFFVCFALFCFVLLCFDLFCFCLFCCFLFVLFCFVFCCLLCFFPCCCCLFLFFVLFRFVLFFCSNRSTLTNCAKMDMKAKRGYFTPNRKWSCFVLHLKIINTFLKTNICILE